LQSNSVMERRIEYTEELDYFQKRREK
jgi:hypothetical protein